MKIIDQPALPKEVFAVKVNPEIMAQAVRVFLANQRQGTQSALTRSEVARTRKKLYKQKGTGGARHGDRKAPIFVGGGQSFAPKPRDYSLKLPDKMKKIALFSALSQKAKDHNLLVVSGLKTLEGKTSAVAKFLSGLETVPANAIIATDEYRQNVYRAARNIEGVTVLTASQLNTYEVLRADKLILMEEAVETFGFAKPVIKKVAVKKIVAKKVTKKKS